MHQLLQALHQKLAALGQGPESLLGTDKPISYRTKPPASIHRELLGICSDPYVLAQQLTHVELVSMDDPYTHIPPGTQGTVSAVDDIGTIFVDWDTSSGLGVAYGVDVVRKVV